MNTVLSVNATIDFLKTFFWFKSRLVNKTNSLEYPLDVTKNANYIYVCQMNICKFDLKS